MNDDLRAEIEHALRNFECEFDIADPPAYSTDFRASVTPLHPNDHTEPPAETTVEQVAEALAQDHWPVTIRHHSVLIRK